MPLISAASLDGYLAPLVDNKCEISLDHCFDGWWSGQEQTVDASEMFARLAFGEATKCGDCRRSFLSIFRPCST